MPNTTCKVPNVCAVMLLAAAVAAVVGCDDPNPAEVRTSADAFPLASTWGATVSPVGTSTVRATLGVKQYLGFHMDATIAVTGAPNATYQWRIFKGDCSVNVAATSNTANNGLVLFETIQSYPDVTTNASGAATMVRTVAGALDSLSAYSVRLRASQSATNWNGTSPIACGDLRRGS
jgi:hypothetical protein